jgi:NAD(P)-dependent dehydrogenase (short-subunit alcohol dehydrogenase family)
MPIALVTGPSSGIGMATALELGRHGFHVIAAGRSASRVQPVIDAITSTGGSAELLTLDLASLASVHMAADRLLTSGRDLDLLVNNAGIGINRRGRTEDGFEAHFGINHLGHFALTCRLQRSLRTGSRVVSVASAVHFRATGIDFERVRRPTRFTGYSEYAVSKLANVLFIRELARRRPELNCFAVHPGLIDTQIIPKFVRPFMRGGLLTPEEGADTVVWCATSDQVVGESGMYYQRRAVATPSLAAQDDDLARELWERSLHWCEG